MRVYVDSDVLIWHLRGEKRAAALLRRLSHAEDCELWVGALQRAEIIFFMHAAEEQSTELLLAQFKTAVVDQRIIDVGGRIFRKWRASHGIDVNDALLAATVLETGGHLYTLNVRHYPMADIIVKKAW